MYLIMGMACHISVITKTINTLPNVSHAAVHTVELIFIRSRRKNYLIFDRVFSLFVHRHSTQRAKHLLCRAPVWFVFICCSFVDKKPNVLTSSKKKRSIRVLRIRLGMMRSRSATETGEVFVWFLLLPFFQFNHVCTNNNDKLLVADGSVYRSITVIIFALYRTMM